MGNRIDGWLRFVKTWGKSPPNPYAALSLFPAPS
ncbi:hypothetical protein HD595_003285 [Nonomuraea roseoviolacea subsp. carminata]|uniref:Uncharacterized protein n=1 Tax=Nonomuraea roseoviolacea subsp. carminata TaxID=160689 RepID=A0ABT1JZH7_9ACTN|nr:hypothetical protein [Nonomuraea roseoviolacea subsp. carminata]